MRLLDRYLLRELLVPLAYCLSGFLLFWIVSDLFSELSKLQELRLRAGDIAEYYLFRIPEFLPVAMPVALLLALLYALTNHARHNEVTAIRAAGVGLWRLCLPYLAVGFTASAVLFVLNEFCAPRTAELAEQIRTRRVQRRLNVEERQIARKINFQNSREDRIWSLGAYNLKTGEMLPPVVVEWHSQDGSWRSIIADRALRISGVWTFYRAHEIRRSASTNSLPVSLPQIAQLAVPEFSETPEEIKSQISISERFAHQSRTHRADLPITDIVNYLRLNPSPPGSMRPWLYTKLYGRFAGPCTCLVVVLIGVPFAAASGRRNVFVGVAASITIFFIYFLLQQFGFAFGEAGRLSPWLAAWLPNMAFGIAGLWMMAKVR
jgi:lipopolysaccharide export system permease protein